MKQKIVMLFLAMLMCYTFAIPIVNVQAAQTLTSNATGTIDGYNYELWKDSGTTSMTLNGGAKFNCSWSNINNALFRIGKKFDSTQTYQQLGNITVNYGCNYQPNGNSYLCVYGWTRSPLVEYYIVDSWGSWRPPGSSSKGTITVDGGTYDVYETTRTNQPSIDGTATFQQYWSVRTSKRTSGTISVTEHFNQWANKGMQLGKMYECALTVEGYQSSGSADVYSNTITIGGSPTPTQSTGPTPTPISGDSTVQCENMSLSGQYAGQISSPFSGVALYANNDAATTTISFSGNSSITLYGASNNSSTAQVSLYIGSNKVGTFSFTGTSESASTVNFNASGSQTVKFVVETDNGSWDAYLDYFSVNGGSSGTNPTPTPISGGSTVQCENMSLSGQYAGQISSPFSGVALYANNDAASTTISFSGNSSITLYGASNNSSTAQVSLYIGSSKVGTFSFAGTSRSASTVNFNASGSQTVKFVVETDNGSWDAYLDYFTVTGGGGVVNPTPTPISGGPNGNVYLCFDDGPNSNSPTLINNLKSAGVNQATLFVWGNRISGNQSAWNNYLNSGFSLQNHSWTHSHMTGWSYQQVYNDLQQCSQAIQNAGKPKPTKIRLPYLESNSTIQSACSALGLSIVSPSVDTQDWNGASTQSIINACNNLQNGGNPLMHDGYSTTNAAIATIAQNLKNRGLGFAQY
jgi:peptidoglycan/xylan/chitin deacetylase (PgdA/CDA1 family)